MARATLVGERTSSAAQTPSTEMQSSAPSALLADSDVVARLAALEAKVAEKSGDDRGQPHQARAPPADTSIRVYTVKETAEILRLGLTRTYDGIVQGRIPGIKIGGRWLVPHDALVRLLATAR